MVNCTCILISNPCRVVPVMHNGLLLVYLFTDESKITMNIHLLQHLTSCVQHYGPLWAYTCFCFESLNNHLKHLFHGTRDMSTQVKISHTHSLSKSLFLPPPPPPPFSLPGCTYTCVICLPKLVCGRPVVPICTNSVCVYVCLYL